MIDQRSVKETYDRIAHHFSQTREYAWPEVEEFLADRFVGRALDVGCGNGRHTELLADHARHSVGVDASAGLLDEAVARAADHGFSASFVQGDAARLPFAENSFDLAVYIATLHHLPSREARCGSLDELARVLAADGRALVSAWSTEHETFDAEEGFDTTVDWTLPGGETVPRFYHIYAPDEFRNDIEASDLRLLDFEIASGNCYGVVTPT